MAKNKKITLTKEEKMAILKVMIDISNHYKERLPNAYKKIQEIETIFRLPNGISAADKLARSAAIDIVKRFYKKAKVNKDYISHILEHLLATSDFGVCKKVKKIYEKYDKDLDLLDKETNAKIKEQKQISLYTEYEAKIVPLIAPFEREWDYIFNILGENIIDSELFLLDIDIYHYIGLESGWTLIDDKTIEPQKFYNQDQITPHKTKNISSTPGSSTEALRKELKDELRKDIIEEMRRELKEEILREMKDEIRQELKDSARKELKTELRQDLITNNIHDIFFKDL